MKLNGIRLVLVMSLVLLVNYDSQPVLATTNEATNSSIGSESAASEDSIEIEESVEPKPALANKIIVSDKLAIEPKKAHAGEQIAFKLTLPEDQTFETIILTYFSSNTKTETTVALTYDSEIKRYEGQLETNKETGIGNWLLIKAVGIEKNNVSHVLETRTLITEESVLKEGDFEMISHPAALFELSSIKVEPNAVKVGEKLQFSLHSANDDLLTNVTVTYRSLSIEGEASDQQLLLSLTFNEETKAYEGELPLIANDLVGDWVIESLSAVDDKSNLFLLYNRFVIELDQAKVQEQIAELNKQLLEEQTAEKSEETDNQSKIDLLKEETKQLKTVIDTKEALFQADLSMGNFTIQEAVVNEVTDAVDGKMPIKNEAESSTSEEAFSLLIESDTAESKETVSAAVTVDKILPIDKQKEADSISMTSEKISANEEAAQTADRSSVGEKPGTDETTEATGSMNGSLFVVLVAFIIINGLIFKF